MLEVHVVQASRVVALIAPGDERSACAVGGDSANVLARATFARPGSFRAPSGGSGRTRLKNERQEDENPK